MPEPVVVDVAYPSTPTERVVCAAALEIVGILGQTSPDRCLSALLLATHADWCRQLLPASDRPRFEAALTKAPRQLLLAPGQSLGWGNVFRHLRTVSALAISGPSNARRIEEGPQHAAVRRELACDLGDLPPFWLKATMSLEAAPSHPLAPLVAAARGQELVAAL
jgi:hypothetical protein